MPNNGGIRNSELICEENGESGLWHDVSMDGEDWETFVCLTVARTSQDPQVVDALPQFVLR